LKGKFMNGPKRLAGKLGIVLGSALLGCATYGQPSVEVGVGVSLPAVVVAAPSVEIRTASDFYEPLAPDGDWVIIGSYGRCWRPGHVGRDWRPYCNGNWQRTEAGWYWDSDESWAWATYHYGRWDFSDEYGWYWVPQTEWAPAWVSWHEGGGYVGWVPLQPDGVRVIRPQAYVFVEERHFMEPVRSTTVVVNNTIIINQTVINQGPATAVIEKASGQRIQPVPARELRQKQEAVAVSRQRKPAATDAKNVRAPVHPEAQLNGRNSVAAPVPSQVQKPAAVPAESKPDGHHPPVVKEPTGQNANKQPVKQEKSSQLPNTKAQPAPKQPAAEKPAASGNNEAKPADNGHDDKSKD
jgi:hypothetical protein